MRISTKGRYALRVMIDLAKNGRDNYVKLQELSARQQISEKYLEGILGTLVRSKLLEGARGKGGGYKLKCEPSECSVWDILSLTETSVAPVACLDDKENKCERAGICITLPVWKELDGIIRGYLEGVKLDQFVRGVEAADGKMPDDKIWSCGL
ncbi:MAG: Rrf2 family transcriptional regulator [Fibrobacter sp.]|nr:Rrf2 family transcriptional regulator [Fibrobacter sp.]